MNTEYSKVVNFETEMEDDDYEAVEAVTVPVTKHTFNVCDGFAVESLAALLPKSDKNIVELVLNSVYKQVENIDNLEALESFSAKFESIRNFFNTPVKNIKEISTSMEPGTESYAAAMESELTQVAFVKNMLGIGEKESCTINDVRDCSDSLKKIATLIETRRVALESAGRCEKKDVATEGKKDSDDDNPPKEGIEDDRVMKPVDDDILTKKEFALAISMAQYFQNREEKGEKVPKLGKGVTWKDVVLGIHKGHYTVNALCDLGGGNIFCKGKDGKLAAVEGSDAKEMFMRAGKGIDGKDVYIVNSDDDLDENGKPKAGAMTRAYKLSKGTEGVEEEPGYLEAETAVEDTTDTEDKDSEGIESEEAVECLIEFDDIPNEDNVDIEALEAYFNKLDEFDNVATYLAYESDISLEGLSDDELDELNDALEAYIQMDYTPEEFINYLNEECATESIKELSEKIANNVYAKTHGISVDMAKVERVYKALTKAYKAFEHPLKVPSAVYISKLLKGAMWVGLGGTIIAGTLGGTGSSLALLAIQMFNTTRSTMSNLKSAAKSVVGKEGMEEADETFDEAMESGRYNAEAEKAKGEAYLAKLEANKPNPDTGGKSIADNERAKGIAALTKSESKPSEPVSAVETVEDDGKGGILEVLKSASPATKALAGLFVGGLAATIAIKKYFKRKEDEDYVKRNLDTYQDVYKAVTKDYQDITARYNSLKAGNGDINSFIKAANDMLRKMQAEYKRLNNILRHTMKQRDKYSSIESGDKRDGYDTATRKALDDKIELNKDMNDITKKMDKAVPSAESFTKELESIKTDHFFDGEWINADEALKRFSEVIEGMESALSNTQNMEDPDEVIQFLDWYDEQRSVIYAAIESLMPFLETVEEEPELEDAMEAFDILEADGELIAIEGRIDKKHPFAINLNSLEAQIANGMKAAASHLRKKNREEALDSLENATRACNEIIRNIASLSKDEFCELTKNPKATDTTFKKFKEKKTMEFERTLKKITKKREKINKQKVVTESFVNEAYEKYLNSLGLNVDGELLNEELEAMESYVSGLAEIAEADGELDLALMEDDFVE